jgi:hypothetical protein
MHDARELGHQAALLERTGDHQKAEALLRAGLKLFPGNPAVAYALGILLMRQGRYSEGWPLYEARHFLSGRPGKPKLSFPEWKGETVERLLVLPEQGLGDQIMFARYINVLKMRGINVELGCAPSLARLFNNLDVKVIPIDGSITLGRYDAWVMMCSLAGIIHDKPPIPYFQVRSDNTSGLAVIISGNNMPDPDRSLDEESANSVLSLPGAVSLLPQDTGARDFQETAEILASMDLVISVDTAGAHLAGAMGVPTWLLLPASADWRWGESSTTDWYPSMRLFRQPARGQWKPVIEEIRTSLGR